MTYDKEVLGKRVEIEFVLEDDGSEEFYGGIITKVQTKCEDKECKRVVTNHYIEFDDGDKKWFDLVEEEKEGRLRWIDATPTIAMAAAAAGERSGGEAGVSRPPKAKKIKFEGSGTISDDMKKEAGDEDEKMPAVVTVTPLSSGRKKTINKEGTSEDLNVGLTRADLPDPKSSMWPKSIDSIIKLMDKLEPGYNFYDRQVDGRGGCAIMRGKLRKHATKVKKEQRKDIAVQHWIDTKDWCPPNKDALLAIIFRIKKSMPKRK